ncbi:uncharacterized protein METZ01_LOCUS212363, partial [marine metagenome]
MGLTIGGRGDDILSAPLLCPGGGMVDAADLKSASREGVGVRVPSWAPLFSPLPY